MGKMTREHRAKQFMPFNALRGYYDMVGDAEIVPENRKELDQELIDQISYTLNSVKKRDLVKIKFYKDYGYKTMIGMVSMIDLVYKKIRIVDELINMEDIIEIAVLNTF